MSPRRYRMRARAEQFDQTRRRIVRAAVRLHGRQGVRATTWDEIAAAVGIGRATVYRHFPGLAELVPACARAAFASIDLPSADQLQRDYADLTSAEARLGRLIRETCECYERASGWLRTAERESHVVPELADAMRRIRHGVAVLVDVVLVGHSIAAARRRVLRALLDFSVWRALRDTGVAVREIPDVLERLALKELESEQRSRRSV